MAGEIEIGEREDCAAIGEIDSSVVGLEPIRYNVATTCDDAVVEIDVDEPWLLLHGTDVGVGFP